MSMENTKPRRGRPPRKFPVKLENFHMPLQLLEQVEKFTSASRMEKAAVYRAAISMFLENYGFKKPEAIEMDLDGMRNPDWGFDANGEPCAKEEIL